MSNDACNGCDDMFEEQSTEITKLKVEVERLRTELAACAAEPWEDGEPPKECGKLWLVTTEDSHIWPETVYVVYWYRTEDKFRAIPDCNECSKIIRHARINPPKETADE